MGIPAARICEVRERKVVITDTQAVRGILALEETEALLRNVVPALYHS